MLKDRKRKSRCAPFYTESLRRLKDRSAFTLLETVLALFLLVLILQGTLAVYWHTLFVSERLQQSAELQYATRRARQHLSRDLGKCHEIRVRDEAGHDVMLGPTLYISVDDGVIQYYMSNRQLYRKGTRGPPLPLAENIADLNFSLQIEGTIAMLVGSAQGTSHHELLCHLSYNRYSDEVITACENT